MSNRKRGFCLALLLGVVLLLALLLAPTVAAEEPLSLGEPSAPGVYGEGSKVNYSISGEGVADADFLPTVIWEKETPQGVYFIYANGVLTLHLSAKTPVGSYPFHVQAQTEAGQTVVSSSSVLVVNKGIYGGATQFEVGSSGGIVSGNKTYKMKLVELPEGASYKAEEIAYGGAALRNLRIENGYLYFATDPEQDTEKKATVGLPVAGGKNYEDFTIYLTITVKGRIPVVFSGITILEKTYDGMPFSYSEVQYATKSGKKADLAEGDIKVYWLTESGMYMTSAPTAAGNYRLLFSVRSDHTQYFGSTTFFITIRKAEVVISPAPLEWEVGEEAVFPTRLVQGVLSKDYLTVRGMIAEYESYVLWMDGNAEPLSAAQTPGAYTLSFADAEGLLAALENSSFAENYAFTVKSAVYSVVAHRHVSEVRGLLRPTCTEAGYTGDTYCSECGELLEKGEATESRGHLFHLGTCVSCGAADPNDGSTEENTEYTYIFMDESGTVYKSVTAKYGTKILPPSDPTRTADENFYYEFRGWSGYSEGMLLSGNATFIALFEAYPVELPEYKLGDVDMNGIVGEADVSLLLAYIIGSSPLEEEQRLLADVYLEDGAGRINAKDALLLRQYVRNKGVSLGKEQISAEESPGATHAREQASLVDADMQISLGPPLGATFESTLSVIALLPRFPLFVTEERLKA